MKASSVICSMDRFRSPPSVAEGGVVGPGLLRGFVEHVGG